MPNRAAHTFVISLLLVACSRPGWAIYGPSLARADVSVAVQACEEGRFSYSAEIVKAMKSGTSAMILPALASVLKQWRTTPATSAFYLARAFCLHELVPENLPAFEGRDRQESPTVEVKEYRELGIDYFFYEPDGRWVLSEDPVDLVELAEKHLNSRWGRQAFLMMTQMGWSQGRCAEGQDQFREVIRQGQSFLAAYPTSEISDAIRLEMANAYATWWNLSQTEPNPPYSDPKDYQAGAVEAKKAALRLYQEYLNTQADPTHEVRDRLKNIFENPKGSDTYDYFCADYAD